MMSRQTGRDAALERQRILTTALQTAPAGLLIETFKLFLLPSCFACMGGLTMKFEFSKKFKLLSVVLLVVGVVSVAFAYSFQRANGVKFRHAKGFTIVTKETVTMNDPRMQAEPGQADYVITARYQKSDGTWKEVRTAYKSNGKVLREHIQFGIPSQGVFEIEKDHGVLHFISQMPPKEETSIVPINDGHDNKRFSRDDIVQGFKTYVLHYVVANDGSYEDEYYAPDLDGYPIKSFKFAPYGSSVTEPLQITLGDPDESVFGSLPNFLVDYDRFEKKIQAIEDDGHHETAEAMRRQLEQERAKKIKEQ